MKDAFTKIISNIADLIDVKSIVTLTMTGIMAAMLLGAFEPKQEFIALFSTAYGSIITYFFTRKDTKEEETGEEAKETVIPTAITYDAVYEPEEEQNVSR